MTLHARSRLLIAGSALIGAGAALAAGLVFAQAPADSAAPPSPEVAPPPLAVPLPDAAPPQEEAPPAVVPALPPEPAPPLEAEKAEPAPEEQAKAEEPEKKEPEAPPAKRIRHNVAVLQALDKITAETLTFEAQVGRPVRYKNLVFTVRACERTTEEEAMEDAIAYLNVESQPKAAPGRSSPPARKVFQGWMYASSPGLHPLEHPVYDAWVITCRAPAPTQVAAAEKSASAAIAAPSRR
ncbi:MAG: DUF2155 domain-containing protein [Phenylobacterium sp.]